MNALVAAILSFGLLGHSQGAAGQKEAPSLRFDGLYDLAPAKGDPLQMHSYLRLTATGDVHYRSTNMTAAGVAGTWTDIWADGPAGRYRLAGDSITIGVLSGNGGECKGTIEDNGLRLACQRTSWASGWYTFAALEFDRPRATKTAERSAEPPAAAGAVSSNPTLPVTLALGSSTMDSGCQHAQLTPAPEPIVFPAGAAELAYQVKLSPQAYSMDVSVSMSSLCESTRQRRCNTYAIVGGRPLNSGWTTVLDCSDGKPFKPGRYQLKLLLNGAAVREIPFEVK